MLNGWKIPENGLRNWRNDFFFLINLFNILDDYLPGKEFLFAEKWCGVPVWKQTRNWRELTACFA